MIENIFDNCLIKLIACINSPLTASLYRSYIPRELYINDLVRCLSGTRQTESTGLRLNTNKFQKVFGFESPTKEMHHTLTDNWSEMCVLLLLL